VGAVVVVVVAVGIAVDVDIVTAVVHSTEQLGIEDMLSDTFIMRLHFASAETRY
jgi:hypothetical protein